MHIKFTNSLVLLSFSILDNLIAAIWRDHWCAVRLNAKRVDTRLNSVANLMNFLVIVAKFKKVIWSLFIVKCLRFLKIIKIIFKNLSLKFKFFLLLYELIFYFLFIFYEQYSFCILLKFSSFSLYWWEIFQTCLLSE